MWERDVLCDVWKIRVYLSKIHDKGGAWRNSWYGYSTVDVVGEGCSLLTYRTCADIHAQTQAGNVCATLDSVKTLEKELLLVNIKHILQLFS